MVVSENKTIVKAVFMTYNEVICPTPKTGSYIVRVTNGGDLYTEEKIFTVFDDECHTCKIPGKCDFKVGRFI